MNDPLPEVDLGDGRTVISYDDGIYRVRMANGEVQAFPARVEATPENAADDVAYAIAHPAPPAQSQAEIFAAQMALGYQDASQPTGTGIKLKCTLSAQNRFTSMLALMRLAVEQGAATNETLVTLWDFDDAAQSLTIEAFRELMLRYGFACKTMFDNYAP